MKKHIMLGVDPTRQHCCILTCLLPFDMLVPDEIEPDDFGYDATNWNGRDTIQRTLDLKNCKCTGRVIRLKNPITYHGVDSDMGLENRFAFKFTEIHESVGL